MYIYIYITSLSRGSVVAASRESIFRILTFQSLSRILPPPHFVATLPGNVNIEWHLFSDLSIKHSGICQNLELYHILKQHSLEVLLPNMLLEMLILNQHSLEVLV